MELKLNIDFKQILGLIHQLPENEIEKLTIALQSEISSKKNTEKNKLQNLILNAPTWTDSDFSEYQEARKHINNSRLI